MHIIKLDATPSTNLYLRQLSLEQNVPDYTIVYCNHQTKGRGQVGTSWESEPGKNLTFSILKLFDALQATDQFRINMAVSLALFDALNHKMIPEIAVKWPNDIMAGNKKICGILIENTLQGKQIKKSIIGIGLNVNQENFGHLIRATSMKLENGEGFKMHGLLKLLLNKLKKRLSKIGDLTLYEDYEKVLYRKGIPTNFSDLSGIEFKGNILGVRRDGKLLLQTENGITKHYNFKEIKMHY